MPKSLFSIFCVACAISMAQATKKDPYMSITTSNRGKNYKPGELIFADEFDDWDGETWSHEITLGGNDHWEFQLYENSRKVSYARNGYLHIKPRLTSETHNIYGADLDMNVGAPAEPCTNPAYYGCWRKGSYPAILNPVSSAQLRTIHSFYFQYGRLEIRAKLPGGDWMWPSFRLVPRFNKYGAFPASGQIDIFESRGNQKLFLSGKNIGSEMITSGLHFGPDKVHNAVNTASVSTNSGKGHGYHAGFHVYGLEWTDDHISFSIDNVTVKTIAPSDEGFWEMGDFDNSVPNPWKHSDHKRMAPFDQKVYYFFLMLNVAVGGVNGYFSDDATTEKGKKPWKNMSPRSTLEFWDANRDWYPTWAGEDGILKVDYIRIYAI